MRAWFRGLLREIGRIADGVDSLLGAVHGLPTGADESGALDDRVTALERAFELRMAESEGLLLKAQGRFEAARAAEERARRLAENSAPESPDDRLDEIVAAYEEAGVPLGNGVGGAEPELHPMPMGVEGRPSRKSEAYAMKFGTS